VKYKIALAAVALAATTALIAVPLTSASSVDTKLQIGYNLRLFCRHVRRLGRRT
jgi:hypothetical protein